MPLNNFGIVARYGIIKLCRSAQPDAEAYDTLKKMGIEVIFKLNQNHESNDNDEMIRAIPIEVYMDHLPELFRIGETNVVIDICKNINHQLTKGRSVLVHCSHGRDRTGLIIGGWQIMYEGLGFNEVNNHRWKYGMNPIIDTIDIEDKFILKEIERLKNVGQI